MRARKGSQLAGFNPRVLLFPPLLQVEANAWKTDERQIIFIGLTLKERREKGEMNSRIYQGRENKSHEMKTSKINDDKTLI